jgi:hypothetical protein
MTFSVPVPFRLDAPAFAFDGGVIVVALVALVVVAILVLRRRGSSAGQSGRARTLDTLSVGDTIILKEDSPLPGSWKVEKAHRFVDLEAQAVAFQQFEVAAEGKKGFIEVHALAEPERGLRAVASFPLEPTEYKAVHALEIDPDEPDARIQWKNVEYAHIKTKPLRFYRNGGEHPRDMIYLEYADDSRTRTLSFEFWSQTGTPVTSEGVRIAPDAVERIHM